MDETWQIQKTIEILFVGRDELTGIIKDIREGFGQIEALATPFANMADAILKLDTALAAMAAGGIAVAYSKSGDFQNASKELEKVLGAEADKIALAGDAAKQLSNQYGIAAATVIESFSAWKQAGFTLQDSINLTDKSIQIAVAGNMSIKEATENLVGTMKGFGAAASDAARIIDIWNKVSNEFATDVPNLSKAMADSSPIAKQMGMTFEETAAILTPIIEVFRSGSEAAVAFRTGMSQLISAQKPVQEALDILKISQTDSNNALRSGKDILWDIMEAYNGLDQTLKAVVAQKLVDVEQSGRMLTVFDGMNKVLDIQNSAMKAQGSAWEEVNTRMQSSDIIIKKTAEALNNLAIDIGDKYLASINSAIDATTGLQKTMASIVKGDNGLNDIFKFLNEIIQKYEEIIIKLQQNLPEAIKNVDFSSLVATIKSAMDEIGKAINIDISTPKGLQDALQKMVNAAENLIIVSKGIVLELSPVLNIFNQLASASSEMEKETAENIGKLLGQAKLIAEAGSVLSAALIAIGNDADKAKAAIQSFVGFIETIANSFQISFDMILLMTSEFFKKFLQLVNMSPPVQIANLLGIDSLKTALDQAIENIKTFQNSVGKDLISQSEQGFKGLEKIIDAFAGKTGTAEKTIESMINKLAGVPSEKEINIKLKQGWEEQFRELEKKLEKEISIIPKIDPSSLSNLPPIKIPVIPEISKGDEEKIEKLKSDINAFFDGYSDAIQAAARAARDFLAGTQADIASKKLFEDIKNAVEKETALRERQLELQTKQVDIYEQIIKNKAAAARDGIKLILNADHLAPHLEMIWFQILEALQLRINEEGADALVGL